MTAPLPGVLSELAALAGEEVARSVAQRFGGCRVSAHTLAQHVEQYFSGEVVTIPKAEHLARDPRPARSPRPWG